MERQVVIGGVAHLDKLDEFEWDLMRGCMACTLTMAIDLGLYIVFLIQKIDDVFFHELVFNVFVPILGTNRDRTSMNVGIYVHQ